MPTAARACDGQRRRLRLWRNPTERRRSTGCTLSRSRSSSVSGLDSLASCEAAVIARPRPRSPGGPSPARRAWALNHVAREETDTIGEWIEAASALRDASATVSGRCSKPRRSTSGSPMSCSWAASPKTSTRPNRSLRKPRRAIYADCQGTAQGQAGINGRDEGRSGGGQAPSVTRSSRAEWPRSPKSSSACPRRPVSTRRREVRRRSLG